MTVSYFIRYAGRSDDAEKFFEHYRTRHAAILRNYPGILACRLHKPIPWHDPVAVTKDDVLVLAELVFETADALDKALASAARQELRRDFQEFPKLVDGHIRHLAVATEVVFQQGDGS